MGPVKAKFRKHLPQLPGARCEGFTIIEVMIATVIMVIGLLSLTGLFATALGTVQNSQTNQIARQKARETMESIYAARNDGSITFDQIQNKADGGIFNGGFEKMYLAGSDGIPGTVNESTTIDRVVLPGKNGVLETSPGATSPAGDDVFVPLTNFQRQISISTVKGSDGSVNLYMRKLVVTIRVTNTNGVSTDFVTSGYISTSQQQ